jgi:hypothetical protein
VRNQEKRRRPKKKPKKQTNLNAAQKSHSQLQMDSECRAPTSLNSEIIYISRHWHGHTKQYNGHLATIDL